MRAKTRILLAGAALMLAGQSGSNAGNESPEKRLAGHFAALKGMQTMECAFACEKRNSLVNKPVVSRGHLWIRRGDIMKSGDGGGAIRFSTEAPSVSEFILTEGKIYVKSGRDKEWSKTDQRSRPGLPAVLEQLGAWSTGSSENISEQFSVSMGTSGVMAIAAGDGMPGVKLGGDPEFFVLVPKSEELRRNVKQITLGIDKGSHYLMSIEILTKQSDVSRYCFFDVKTESKLPTDVFKPEVGGMPAVPSSSKP